MSRVSVWPGLLLALALFAVLGVHYWAHKPLMPAQALALANTLGNLLIALLLTAAAGGVGHWLLRHTPGALLPHDGQGAAGERFVLQAAVGLGALGLAMLGLGLLRALHAGLAWALLAALLALLRRDVRAWARDGAAALRALAVGGAGGPAGKLAGAFSAAILSMGLLRSLAPPLAWDALVYHLTLPRLYIRLGELRLDPLEFSVFTGMPQFNEMLNTAAMLLRLDAAQGAIAAQVLGWVIGALLALGLASLAASMGLPARLALAVLLASFSVYLLLAWAYSDLLPALYALCCFMALRRWLGAREAGRQGRAWLILAGALAGLAWSCKYTAFIVPLGGGALVLAAGLTMPGRGGRRAAVAHAAVFSLACLLVFAPWLVKNWAFTGSPIYPLAVPAADMDSLRQWFYTRADLAEQRPLAAAGLFFRAVLLGQHGGSPFSFVMGPLFLYLPLALVVGWRKIGDSQRAELAPLAIYTLAAYAGWVAMAGMSALGSQGRLFLPALPGLALLCAGGAVALRRLDSPALRISVVSNAAIGLVLLLALAGSGSHFAAASPLGYLTGVQTAAAYRADQLGWYGPAIDGLNDLPAGARVLFLWEPRSLECSPRVTCLPDVVIDRWWHLQRTGYTPATAIDLWRAQGVTHVFLYDGGVRFEQSRVGAGYQASDWAALNELLGLLRPLESLGGVYSLYAMP